MTTRIISILGIFLLSLPALAFSAPDEVAHFELSLAGYQLGMSIDEASQVRPFHYFNSVENATLTRPVVTIGSLDSYYINDIDFAIKAHFSQDKLWKLIGRFPADEFETVRKRLLQTLGQGEDRSKVLRIPDGHEAKTEVYRWSFPAAKLSLVGPARGLGYATIAITEATPQPGEQEESTPGQN